MISHAQSEPDLVAYSNYPWLHRLVCLYASTAGAVVAVSVLTDGGRRLGRWRGFWHAHLGWLRSGRFGYRPGAIPDLARRADLSWFDRHWLPWYAAGLLAPAAAGYLVGGTGYDVLIGFLWGGLLRHFLTTQATLLVNSVNHLWGTRPYATADGSRNNLLTGILAFGEVIFSKKNADEVDGGSGCAPLQTRPGIRTPGRSDGGRGCRTLPGTRTVRPALGRG